MSDKNDLNQDLDKFLGEEQEPQQDDCNGDKECLIKQNKGLVERINKKIVTEDGRELLT